MRFQLVGSAGMGTALTALSFALGAVSRVYIAELFPTAIRGRAMSIATLALWAACLLVTMTFLTLVRALSPASAFRVYAALCAATFLFVWFRAPETKGRTLEQIQHMWKPR